MSNLTIHTQCHVSGETLARNIASAPDLPAPSGVGKLAVVGGGHSLKDNLEVLRAWDGDIWAVNATYDYLTAQGIDAYAYSVDPHPMTAVLFKNAHKAVVAEHCDPSVFKALDGRDVYVIDGSTTGPTSAVVATVAGLQAGYDHVTFFGCEGSYGETTHLYPSYEGLDLVRLECNGNDYLTKLEFISQTEQLADVLRTFPDMYAEQSGAFLRDLIEHGDFTVTHVSKNIKLEAA